MVCGRTRYKRAQALADGGSDTGGKTAAGAEKQAGSAEGYVHIVPLKMHMLVPIGPRFIEIVVVAPPNSLFKLTRN